MAREFESIPFAARFRAQISDRLIFVEVRGIVPRKKPCFPNVTEHRQSFCRGPGVNMLWH